MTFSARPHFLLHGRVTPKVQKLYKAAVHAFGEYLARRQEQDPSFLMPLSIDALDTSLTDYFHDLHETFDGRCRHRATQALYGLRYLFPTLSKASFPRAHASLNGWARVKAGTSYPPFTFELTVLIAATLDHWGFHAMGVLTLLSFDCLLRINEGISLRKEDFADADDLRLGAEYRCAGLRIRHAKTGTNQWVAPQHPSIVALVQELAANTPCGQHIFPFSAPQFRYRFKVACARLHLSSQYVPHSLRHGGATRAHLNAWLVYC
jgi:integrase